MAAPAMQWLDYVIFVVFLVASLGIGIFHSLTGGKQKTTQEFIMANRKLHVIPTMMSLLASYTSAILILGSTAEMYNWGIQAWVLSIITQTTALFLTERLVVPWIYGLQLTSTYEYLTMRFKSRAVAIMGAALGILKAIVYMGTAIFAASIAMESACGFPTQASIPVMSLLCTAYTALGGMRAVIWTDVLQFLIMFAGLVTVLIKGNISVGGFTKVLEYVGKEGRLKYIDFSWDFTRRHTFWGFIIGGVPMWFMLYGLSQASVQRYSATKSLKEARLTLLLGLPTSLLMWALANMTGLTVLAYFSMIKCDPIANGDVTSSNQILSFFVNIVFKNATGFSGLFLATIYSGALSSVSSSLSGAAANMWESILKYLLPPMSDSSATLINKGLVLVFGAISTGIAFLASTMPGPVSQISGTLGGAVGGSLIGMFFLGGIFSFTEWKGVMVGGLTGLAFNLWVGIGARSVPPVNFPLPPVSTEGCSTDVNSTSLITRAVFSTNLTGDEPFRPEGLARLYSVSYVWYSLIGCFMCVGVGIIVSLIAIYLQEEKAEPVPERLLIQWRAALSFSNYQTPKTEKVELRVKYHQAGKART